MNIAKMNNYSIDFQDTVETQNQHFRQICFHIDKAILDYDSKQFFIPKYTPAYNLNQITN